MENPQKVLDTNQAIDVLTGFLNQNDGVCRLAAISGLSGSGKTYFARKLAKILEDQGSLPAYVSLDDYFRSYDDPFLPCDSEGRLVYDLPESYSESEYVMAICQLLRGQRIQMPVFDKPNLIRKRTKFTVEPAKAILTEGLFSIKFLRGISEPALHIYMDVDREVCLARIIKRNKVLFGTTEEQIVKRFDEMVWPYFEEWLAPQRSLADIVVKN